MQDGSVPVGGAFVLEETPLDQVLIPEKLSMEARLMAKTMEEFLRREVLPVNSRLEAQESGLMRSLMQQAGQLGLLAGSVPERYGGLNLTKADLTLLAEKSALNLSFAISMGVHSGVSLMPLLWFGTPEQQQRYLPRLASGEMIGAFALSEANSGSDARSAQTRATRTPDGKQYLLHGAKMWTTNGGFADLFTLFAQIDGEQFTAFLVERDTPGLSVGREEHKLGLHGSSTCRLLLEGAQVPAENVLGAVGKGHYPALYALNPGRLTIGATALGAAKTALKMATQYARQRVQFGRPIAHFGLIQHKLAEMATRIFVLESMIYRTAGYWDAAAGQKASGASDAGARDSTAGETAGKGVPAEEYAIECALLKFFGTEVLDYVVDEALQIHGGYGYSEEFPIAQIYRDARVFRIFEGTNEINRLTVLEQLLRRLKRGRLALPPLAGLQATLFPEPFFSTHFPETLRSGAPLRPQEEPQEEIGVWVAQIRKTVLYTLSLGRETLGEGFLERQEVAAALADMIAALFACESAWLRCCMLQRHRATPSNANSLSSQHLALAATRLYGAAACALVAHGAREALAAMHTSDSLAQQAARVGYLLPIPLVNAVLLRRQIAAAVIEREGYVEQATFSP